MKKHKWFMPVWVFVVLSGACASTWTEDERLSEQGFQELSGRNYREAEPGLRARSSLRERQVPRFQRLWWECPHSGLAALYVLYVGFL